MRILVLIHEYPPIGGGGGHVAHDIARELSKRGHNIHVLAPHIKGVPFQSYMEGVKVIRFLSFRRRLFAADMLAMLGYVFIGFFVGLWEISNFHPDVIHVHFGVPAGALAWILHTVTGIPYVLTSHLGDVPGGVPEKTDRWFRWIFPFTPRIWRDAVAVTAISEFTRRLALVHYPVDISVIPNGIHLTTKIQIQVHTPPRIIFAGRFVQQKNLFNLVKMLNEIKDLHWDCVLIGDGILFRAVVKEVERYDLAKRVKFARWLSSDQVLEQLGQADIFLLPSLSEGISVSALQALASGLAIVASRVGGLIDLVQPGKNGYLHAPTDISAFGASLRSLLTDNSALYQARLASLKISEMFDLEKIVDRYEEVLRASINAKRSG